MGLSIDDVREAFQQFDKDESGGIDWKEFKVVVLDLLNINMKLEDLRKVSRRWWALMANGGH